VEVLTWPEGMNDGKSPAWWARAQQAYPSADYIAKMDSDTRICPDRILEELTANRGTAYFGSLSCREYWNKKPGCYSNGKHVKNYMSGGLHIMSDAMVQKVNSLSKNGNYINFRPEDMNTGSFVWAADPKFMCGRRAFATNNTNDWRVIQAYSLQDKLLFRFQQKDIAFEKSLCEKG